MRSPTGGRESEREAGLDCTTRQILEAVAGPAPQQGAGKEHGGECPVPDAVTGNSVAPEKDYLRAAMARVSAFRPVPGESVRTEGGGGVSPHF